MTIALSALAAAFLAAASPAVEPASFPEVGVPFGCGNSFPVSQAHEVGSHLQNDTWAWDFRMPEGVPIVAARGGVVRLARGDSNVGGCDPAMARYANYVVVDHGDGFETQYLHFSEVSVRPGDSVKSGQLLGFSGSTGWACGSHLHFKVARVAGPGWNNPSVPARIAGYGDPDRGVLIVAPTCQPGGGELHLASQSAGRLEDATAAAPSAPAPDTAPTGASSAAPSEAPMTPSSSEPTGDASPPVAGGSSST